MAVLEEGRAARSVDLTAEEALAVKGLQLLTRKPLTYAANVSESDLADGGASNAQVTALQKKAKEESCEVVVVSAQVLLPILAEPSFENRKQNRLCFP